MGIILRNNITFIVLCSNLFEEIFISNLKCSPCICINNRHEVIVVDNFSLEFPCVALNKALTSAKNNTIVFSQSDVYLPENWDVKLLNIIQELEDKHINWAVLGIYGASHDNKFYGHLYSNGLKRELGKPQPPIEAQSLDETLFILNKKTGIRFDDNFPNLTLYGNDLLNSASKNGFKNYIISNFLIHNSVSHITYGKNDLTTFRYFRKKWKDKLPFLTSYGTVYSQMWKNIYYKYKQDLKYELPFYRKKLGLVTERHSNPSSIHAKNA